MIEHERDEASAPQEIGPPPELSKRSPGQLVRLASQYGLIGMVGTVHHELLHRQRELARGLLVGNDPERYTHLEVSIFEVELQIADLKKAAGIFSGFLGGDAFVVMQNDELSPHTLPESEGIGVKERFDMIIETSYDLS